MLKGKSNGDIGTILDIGGQTVRHHSMAIFARLGVGGRLALQRAVLRSILDAG
jgi:DNA-binding CsgD family transcriptional regulator